MTICPVKAIDSKPPPTGFDREKCVGFVDFLKEKTADQVKLCGLCFDKCPAGKLVKETLGIRKWKTLTDLGPAERQRFVGSFTCSL
jgi:Fe-S-cluster-containing hydrogenase component 2